MTEIAKTLNYDGDAIARVFIDSLTDANFHTEARAIADIWDAMQWVPLDQCGDKLTLVNAAIAALEKYRNELKG